MINWDHYKNIIKQKPGALSKAECNQIVVEIQNKCMADLQRDDRVMVMGKVYRPNNIVRYDIFSTFICGSPHPALVYKTDNEYVYAVTLSSTEAPHNLFIFEKSRMFAGKFMTNNIIKLPHADALSRFIGIFDARKEADKAFIILRNFYKDLFKL